LSGSVSDTIRQLSSVAVLLDQVTAEEVEYEPDPLVDPILRLHDHHGHGIYNILCRLHNFWVRATRIDQRAISVSQLVNETSRLTLTGTTQSSHRHLRTYSILHDLEQLLSRHIARFENFIAAAL
jgi:hypothetical protein